MFLRMVSMNMKAEHSLKLAQEYEKNVIATLRHQAGCNFASFLQNINDKKDCISLTIWNSKQEADEYEKSGVFKRLVDSLRTYFEDSNEWEMKLTDDLSIEYTPIQADPSVKGFEDNASEKESIQKFHATPYAAKIMTLTVQPDKIQEFQETFVSKVIPKFNEQKGFVQIILLQKNNEFNSISFWDETIDLNSSFGEQTDRTLTKSIVELLPSSVQWQVSHKGSRSNYATTEEMKGSVYRCLTGEWFSK